MPQLYSFFYGILPACNLYIITNSLFFLNSIICPFSFAVYFLKTLENKILAVYMAHLNTTPIAKYIDITRSIKEILHCFSTRTPHFGAGVVAQ